MQNSVKRAVIYTRLSVTNEESVSIARQLESCRRYAESQGWIVVAEKVDDGVSATHNKPEQRKGWQEVLKLEQPFDVVIVWKTDRLARRVIDFLRADEALQARHAGVVSVTEPVNMSDANGRAFATMLAVFAELEAQSISARVKGARNYLIRNGRLVGGTVPYGYRKIANPDGPGYVLAQDPDTIDWLQGMADRALAGETLYSVQQWLNSEGAPLPTTSQKQRKSTSWGYSTVERLLRNPTLAGLTAFNPGNSDKTRGDEVLRDENGMPIVDESLQVITTEQRRQLLALLDNRDSPQAQPRASKGTTPALLSGLVECGHCQRRMYRGTSAGRPVLGCPQCYQQVGMTQLTDLIGSRLVDERGKHFHYIETEETIGDAPNDLPDIEAAIRDITDKMQDDDADIKTLTETLAGLKAMRAEARQTEPTTRVRATGNTVQQEWKFAADDLERRSILISQIEDISVTRGRVGRYLDPARIAITWKEPPEATEGTRYIELPEPDHSRWAVKVAKPE